MKKEHVWGGLFAAALVVVLLMAGFFFRDLLDKPEPVGQSTLPEIVVEESGSGDGHLLTPTLSRRGRGGQACIFSEGIRGCVYNDRLGRKEGPDAYKWYDMEVVLWKVAR